MDPTEQPSKHAENLQIPVSADEGACDVEHGRLPETREKCQGRLEPKESKRDAQGQDMLEPWEPSVGPHSAFTLWQKRLIVSLGAAGGWFSTASSFIFFPAIPFLARDLRQSTERINLTVTSYLIASGVFPSIIAGLSDVYGRRPIFIAALGSYVAVNIGLALQRSFGVLLGLRMLQAAAVSGTFSFAYGVLGDVTTPADRGGFIGLMSIFLNTPQSVAPLISGLLLVRWSWPTIFWFLALASGTVFLSVLFFLPETCRNVVGDGTLPTKWPNKVILPCLKPPRPRQSAGSAEAAKPVRKKMITPLEIFMIFKNPGTTLSILCYGLFYTMYSCLQTSLSTIFVEQYRVSGLAAGLSYLPFGVASMTAAIFAGKLLDKEYARVATSQGITLVKGRLDDLTDFPIERARLGVTKYAVLLCVPCIVGYGWALQYHAHMAVPLVLQFLIGFTTQVNFTSLNALLADYHSDRTATAQAACNLFRCELAAGALALLDVMLRRLGPGWCFVVIAVVHGVAFPSVWAVERYGLAWRRSGKQDIGGK